MMLNFSMLKLIEHLTAKSKGLRWGTGYLFVIFTSPLGPIIIYPGGGEVEDFRGSHDFQGERGEGNLRWPTTVKAKQKVTALQSLLTAKQN